MLESLSQCQSVRCEGRAAPTSHPRSEGQLLTELEGPSFLAALCDTWTICTPWLCWQSCLWDLRMHWVRMKEG